MKWQIFKYTLYWNARDYYNRLVIAWWVLRYKKLPPLAEYALNDFQGTIPIDQAIRDRIEADQRFPKVPRRRTYPYVAARSHQLEELAWKKFLEEEQTRDYTEEEIRAARDFFGVGFDRFARRVTLPAEPDPGAEHEEHGNSQDSLDGPEQ